MVLSASIPVPDRPVCTAGVGRVLPFKCPLECTDVLSSDFFNLFLHCFKTDNLTMQAHKGKDHLVPRTECSELSTPSKCFLVFNNIIVHLLSVFFRTIDTGLKIRILPLHTYKKVQAK